MSALNQFDWRAVSSLAANPLHYQLSQQSSLQCPPLVLLANPPGTADGPTLIPQ